MPPHAVPPAAGQLMVHARAPQGGPIETSSFESSLSFSFTFSPPPTATFVPLSSTTDTFGQSFSQSSSFFSAGPPSITSAGPSSSSSFTPPSTFRLPSSTFITTTGPPSISTAGPSTETDEPRITFGESSNRGGPVAAAVGAIIGFLSVLFVVICVILCRRRRRRKRAKAARLKVEKPFGTEAGFHLAVDTSCMSSSAVQPYTATPSELAPLAPVSSASKGSPISPGNTPVSSTTDSSTLTVYPTLPGSTGVGMSQQDLVAHLHMLRTQIQQVEELARVNGVATSVHDSSEPPPEYAAAATSNTTDTHPTSLYPAEKTRH
ncbi:hypothetical protein CPC08DRAFT_751450 [Agrocybe pediades]|nr:hypothetical protein CPC08DRAFT_751450 [Agrocybe pediades]